MDLSHNEIVDIAPLKTAFKSLRFLDLRFNKISSFPQITELIKSYPDCNIEARDGNCWDLGTRIH